MQNFEFLFNAQAAKLKTISKMTKLPECIAALMLMSSSAIDYAQRASVLASAASSSASWDAQSKNDKVHSC